jgi:hypothetical protein
MGRRGRYGRWYICLGASVSNSVDKEHGAHEPCSLTLDFDQDRQVTSSALDPGFEGREELEIFAVRSDMNMEVLAIFWGCLIQRGAVFEMGGEFFGVWWTESECSAVWRRYGLSCRVKLQRAGERECGY